MVAGFHASLGGLPCRQQYPASAPRHYEGKKAVRLKTGETAYFPENSSKTEMIINGSTEKRLANHVTKFAGSAFCMICLYGWC